LRYRHEAEVFRGLIIFEKYKAKPAPAEEPCRI
jgi:hypothetical protein